MNSTKNPWPARALAVLFLSLALERLANTTPDADLWGYLAFGRLFWETGRFPYGDVFAYLPTLHPWVYHEWLTGVVLYPIYQTAGAAGLQLLKYALALTAVGLVYLTARGRGAAPLAAVLALFLVQPFLGLGYSPVRAQAFTYALFPLTLYLLETARLTGSFRRLWLVAPLMAVWANLHGGFLAGLGLIALYTLGEGFSRRPFLPFAAAFLAAGLATLINPYGLDYWRYLAAAVALPRPEITEWLSVTRAFQEGVSRGEFLLFAAVLAFTLVLSFRTHSWEPTPLLALAVTAALGFKVLRHQVFCYLLVGAYLPLSLARYLETLRADPQLMNLARRLGWKVPALLGALLVSYNLYLTAAASPLSFQLPDRPDPSARSNLYYPVGAVSFIKEHQLAGSLLTDFNWGEYLIWTLYPRCRVSLDGRFETVYPQVMCREYFDFIYARPNWRQILEKYPPRLILIDSRAKIYTLLLGDPSFKEVYRDRGSALFLPQGRAFQPAYQTPIPK